MHFSRSSPNAYDLFADLENDGVYDPDFLDSYLSLAATYPNGEIVETDTLQQGYSISGLCGDIEYRRRDV